MCVFPKLWDSSVQFSCSVVSDSLWPHESQHTRPPCPSPTPGVHSDSCPSSQWYHPAISSSVVPFSSCPQTLPASESFPMSQLFPWGGQSTGVSALASFLPRNTQGWSPWVWTGWTSLQSCRGEGGNSWGQGGLYWCLGSRWTCLNWAYSCCLILKTGGPGNGSLEDSPPWVRLLVSSFRKTWVSELWD